MVAEVIEGEVEEEEDLAVEAGEGVEECRYIILTIRFFPKTWTWRPILIPNDNRGRPKLHIMQLIF